MFLFIGFISPSITYDYVVDSFHDTFGVDVQVTFSKIQRNQCGTQYKSATIQVTNSTREMGRFIMEIQKHGFNQFNHSKNDTWNVKIKDDFVIPTQPKIIF